MVTCVTVDGITDQKTLSGQNSQNSRVGGCRPLDWMLDMSNMPKSRGQVNMSPHIYIFNGHVIATHTRWCLIWFLWQGKAKVVDDLQTAWQKIRSDQISLKLKLQDFCSMDLIFFYYNNTNSFDFFSSLFGRHCFFFTVYWDQFDLGGEKQIM